jgi:RNA polymerase sigma-B factor
MAVEQRERQNEYREFLPLFHQLADSRAPRARRMRIRERLITEHLPVAEHIARRFRNRGQPSDDLRQVARVGLINAVDRFDPDRGTDFLSFAVPTITGEVRRYFRDATWSVRVPRRLKELHTDITGATARLAQSLGRAPTPSELAQALRVPISEVYEGLQVGYAYRAESLDEQPTGDDTPRDTGRFGSVDPRLDLVENREALGPALARLPEREAAIVAMRFFGDMTQTQIAQRMGISQMHVSRLLTASLKFLRTAITEPDPAERTPN